MPRIVTNVRLCPRVAAALARLALGLSVVTGCALNAYSGPVEVALDDTAGQSATPTAVSAARLAASSRLPATVGGWTKKAPARTIAPSAIFEYMDGAGELYLAYRLERLDVVEYGSDTAGDILVELYWMGSSDDAFGLLSGDWGGEPVALRPDAGAARSPWPRALYGSGLLRIWSDDLYARVLASRDSETARTAVLALGRAITEGRADPPPPRLSTSLPPTIAAGFRLRSDRLCFLRSHLVLNSIYFLGQRDMLDLGPSVEAVTVPYDRRDGGSKSVRPTVLAVRYGTPDLARRALAHFRTAYLPGADAGAGSNVQRIEDGWVGVRAVGRCLALVFEAPDRDAAQALLSGFASGLEEMEASHE